MTETATIRRSHDADSNRPLIVVGAGAAGMACALAAGEVGVPTVLVEQTDAVGGTVAHALIHTIGGLFDDQAGTLAEGMPAELLRRLGDADPDTGPRRIGRTRVLDVDPAVYAQVVEDWLRATPGVDVLTETRLVAAERHEGRIAAVTLARGDVRWRVEPRAVVDATGDAHVIRGLGPELVDDDHALAGYIVCLSGAEDGALRFPRGVAILREVRKVARAGGLPAECATVWLDAGVRRGEVYAKFNLPARDFEPARMASAVHGLVGFLRTLHGLSGVSIAREGRLGVRDGGRIRGRYRLTESDVLTGRRFADVACRASWPIEHWHPERGLSLEYLPDGLSYDIPLRSLALADHRDVWAVGRCLSAEPRAQSSARVAGTCWGMGAAVGRHIARATVGDTRESSA